jgi:hypothetical protein
MTGSEILRGVAIRAGYPPDAKYDIVGSTTVEHTWELLADGVVVGRIGEVEMAIADLNDGPTHAGVRALVAKRLEPPKSPLPSNRAEEPKGCGMWDLCQEFGCAGYCEAAPDFPKPNRGGSP